MTGPSYGRNKSAKRSVSVNGGPNGGVVVALCGAGIAGEEGVSLYSAIIAFPGVERSLFFLFFSFFLRSSWSSQA